jgi:copper resistance protein D
MNLSVIAIRAFYFAAALQLFGLLNYGSFIAPIRRRLWPLLLTAAVAAAMAGWLALEATEMSGDAISLDTLGIVLRETRFGELSLARAILLVGLFATLLLPGRFARIAATAAAGGVLALTAAAGHAGAEGIFFQFGSDAVHLLAVGAWLGGLVPFAVAMTRPQPGAIAWRFSTLGTICVGVILVTGSINAWFLVGNGHALIGTAYGRLLLLKIVLFVAMVAFAAVNRFRLTPRAAVAALRRNALIETALGLGIVGIVAVLGTMAPGYYAGN